MGFERFCIKVNRLGHIYENVPGATSCSKLVRASNACDTKR